MSPVPRSRSPDARLSGGRFHFPGAASVASARFPAVMHRPIPDGPKARVAGSGSGDYGSGVSPTRLFTVIGLLGIILAAGLAIAGAWLFALVLLGGIAATGIAITVVNWLAHR